MTSARYQRFCKVIYRLEENGRRLRWIGLAFNLRLSKALFDDHGEFAPTIVERVRGRA